MNKANFSEIPLSRAVTFLTVEQVPRLIVDAMTAEDPREEEEQQTIYLHRAIRNGALKTLGPTMAAADPLQAIAPSARILIGDLIRYLESTIPAVRLRFHDPAEVQHATAPVIAEDADADLNQRHAWQEEQIIRSLKALDFKPLALPVDDRKNNFYVKSSVRARCGKIHAVRMRASVFDKAWERMLGKKTLVYA